MSEDSRFGAGGNGTIGEVIPSIGTREGGRDSALIEGIYFDLEALTTNPRNPFDAMQAPNRTGVSEEVARAAFEARYPELARLYYQYRQAVIDLNGIYDMARKAADACTGQSLATDGATPGNKVNEAYNMILARMQGDRCTISNYRQVYRKCKGM
ncbi:hypothetical protein KGQ71_03315 [Patescibacteria group bacterium]|nr:hypothetical protein [Patescibacteria group bacterium]